MSKLVDDGLFVSHGSSDQVSVVHGESCLCWAGTVRAWADLESGAQVGLTAAREQGAGRPLRGLAGAQEHRTGLGAGRLQEHSWQAFAS